MAATTLLISLIFVTTTFQALAQEGKLTIKRENYPLKNIIVLIQEQTEYSFIYSSSNIDVNRPVTIDVKEATLDDVLTKIGEQAGFDYKIVGRQIILSPRTQSAQQPQPKPQPSRRSVRGKVTSKTDKVPLVGVSVTVEDRFDVGTSTLMDGTYELFVDDDALTIVFEYMGMVTVKRPIAEVLNIQMVEDATQIGEIVVTGITVTDKRLFTGAAEKLDADDVKMAGVAEIGRALEGKAAGVSVQNVSGTFGVAPRIRVRGATSIFGSSKPLWVVDGVPIEDVVDVSADDLSSGDANTLISSAISGINSDDIESIQILKDGSATSIYGARAMAGVIVVTTKRGRSGHSSMNYTGEFTVRMKPSYNEFNIMNSQDQMAVYQEMAQKGWLNYASVSNASNSGVYGKMYQLLNTYNAATGQFALLNNEESRTAYLRQAEARNTDWFDVLFTNNLQQTHSVSMSSGTEKSNYYASLSVLTDDGWTQASSVDRYTANLNASHKITPNLELNIISNGSYRQQMSPGTLSQSVDVVSGTVKRDFDINPYSYALNTSRTLDSNEFYTRNYSAFNIVDELNNNYIDIAVTDLKFQGELRWKIKSGIEWSNLAAIRYQSSSQEHNIKDDSNQARAYRAMATSTIRDANSYLYTDPDDPYALPISVLPYGGIYKRTDHNMQSFNYRSTFRYNRGFDNGDILNFNGGLEISSTRRHATWFRGWGLQYSMGDVPLYAYQVFKKGSENGSQYYELANSLQRFVAGFANFTYSYQGRYTISGTSRYEGSNKFGKARSARWLPTWNISGAWNVHQEEWFDEFTPTISNLMFRTSYSLTADSGPASVSNSNVIIGSGTPWRPYTELQESALYIASLANEDLTYEKKKEWNIGMSVGFLNNRINLETDYFVRDNYDLIGVINTQGVGGESSKYGNVAAMNSSGLEISLSTRNIVATTRSDFGWTTDFVYTHTTNRVTKLQSNKRMIDMITGNGFAKEGYPVRSLFSIPFAGLNSEGLPQFYTADGDKTITEIYFQTRDTGKNELDFLVYEGSVDPTDYGSIRNEFVWNGFRLNLFLTYSFGNVIRLDPVFSAAYSDLTSMSREYKNRWVNPGDEQITTIPVIASYRTYLQYGTKLQYAYSAYNYSTERVAKGDFVRLKEISLAYDFKSEVAAALKASSLSVKLQLTNLCLLYADKRLNGQDPEFSNSGGVATPVPRQFTFTVKIGF